MNVPIDYEEIQLSGLQGSKATDLDAAVASLNRTKVGLKGIIRSPIDSLEVDTLNMRMRRMLDLYATVVHIRSLPGVPTRHGKLDFVIVREQLEGEYSSLEHESIPGVVESLKITTRKNCERIAKFAFDYAVRNGRTTVTAVHKANIMKLGDGLFLETCQNVSHLYPRVKFTSMIIDNCCMQLVSRPQQFDVMVMPNLYGNIVHNLAAGLVGGAGVVPGVCFGPDVALFEPGTRHSYTAASGRDIANPTAILLATCRLLRHINLTEYGNRLESAVHQVLRSGQALTADIGGQATTTQFTESLLSHLQKDSRRA
ncbi:unnamed protein product [Dicrocoelium dendriticum]|nr:unnamed protein product [Dicrocoelium dendriticum]